MGVRVPPPALLDGLFTEWDDARSGGFEPLRFVPKEEKADVAQLLPEGAAE